MLSSLFHYLSMEHNMELNYDDYTITNALLYKNFLYHCDKAFTSKETIGFGVRICHLLAAIAEATPIIGQIIAIFETIIVRNFTTPEIKPQPEPQPKLIQLLKPYQPQQQVNPPLQLQFEPIVDEPKLTSNFKGYITPRNILIGIISTFAIGILTYAGYCYLTGHTTLPSDLEVEEELEKHQSYYISDTKRDIPSEPAVIESIETFTNSEILDALPSQSEIKSDYPSVETTNTHEEQIDNTLVNVLVNPVSLGFYSAFVGAISCLYGIQEGAIIPIATGILDKYYYNGAITSAYLNNYPLLNRINNNLESLSNTTILSISALPYAGQWLYKKFIIKERNNIHGNLYNIRPIAKHFLDAGLICLIANYASSLIGIKPSAYVMTTAVALNAANHLINLSSNELSYIALMAATTTANVASGIFLMNIGAHLNTPTEIIAGALAAYILKEKSSYIVNMLIPDSRRR